MCNTTLITHQKCIVSPPSPVEACSPGSSQMIPQGRMAREPGRWPPARIGKGSPPACGAKQPVQGQARRIGLLDGTGTNERYANLCSAPLRGTANPLRIIDRRHSLACAPPSRWKEKLQELHQQQLFHLLQQLQILPLIGKGSCGYSSSPLLPL